MTFEHKLNTGTLFKNDFRQRAEHPTMKGQINVEGKLYDIAAWTKEGKDGSKFFSLKVSEPYVKQDRTESSAPPPDDPLSDEIPF